MEKSSIGTPEGITFSFASNKNIFPSPEHPIGTKLKDGNSGLEIKTSLIKNSGNSFLTSCKGEYNVLEPLRIKILEHLRTQNFDQIYILHDDISTEISKKIYPLINEIENGLRKYLVRFFVTKIGHNWWTLTADIEMNKKVMLRKNNEAIFSGYIENKIYLIDFGELGKLVYSQSSGFIDKHAIVQRVLQLDETPEAISQLKGELDTNYNKFFKEIFKSNNFQEKWEEIEKIRHKVAHNNLFSEIDLQRAELLHSELMKIINEANSKIDGIEFSEDEKYQIQETIASNSILRPISQQELLEKLDGCVSWAESRDGFLSLKHFVVNYLGSAGFHYGSTNHVIEKLEKDGIIELYDFIAPGMTYSIRAIKRKQPI